MIILLHYCGWCLSINCKVVMSDNPPSSGRWSNLSELITKSIYAGLLIFSLAFFKTDTKVSACVSFAPFWILIICICIKKINKQKFQTAMYLMKYTGSVNITWTLWNSTHCKFIPSQFLRFPSRDFFLNLGLYPFWEHIMQTGWAEEWLAMTSSGMSIGFWFPQTKHTKGKLFLLWK